MVGTSIVVISDLHVGEGVLDDFDAELECHLVAFLDHLGGSDHPVELVVNGDFLDFAQASPWKGPELVALTRDGVPLCFTEAQSNAKFASIRRAHPAVFGALKSFLARHAGHRLVVIPGNHDADFFWPSVRQAFIDACATSGSSDQVRFHLERVYRPSSAPWLWIEHGHQYDPVNAFAVAGEERWSEAKPPVLIDEAGTPRLIECIGTRFMQRFMNHLDARYPLVDNVKPFSRFLKIFGASVLSTGRGPLDALIALAQMTGFVARTLAKRPSDLMSETDPSKAVGDNPLAAWLQNASEADREKLVCVLRDAGARMPAGLDITVERAADSQKLMELLSNRLESLQGLGEREGALLGADPGTLALGASFLGDETGNLRAGARKVAAHDGVRAVIMGHTHEPVCDSGAFTYFNTGSWTRYFIFEDNEKTHPWRMLRESSYERFPYRLQYASVRPGDNEVTLELWRERTKM